MPFSDDFAREFSSSFARMMDEASGPVVLPMESRVSAMYNMVKSKATLGGLATYGVGALGTPAAIGFLSSGGEPRGAWEGMKGGAGGAFSGLLTGALIGGAVGAGLGLGLSSKSGRKWLFRQVKSLAPKYGASIHPYAKVMLPELGMITPDMMPEVAIDTMRGFMRASVPEYGLLGGVAGGGIGALGGSALGMITGAWSAGRNVRASTPYNQFSGIGL